MSVKTYVTLPFRAVLVLVAFPVLLLGMLIECVLFPEEHELEKWHGLVRWVVRGGEHER